MELSVHDRRAIAELIEEVADRSHQMVLGWTKHGSGSELLQSTKFDFMGERFTVLRNFQCSVLVYDKDEIDAFVDGIKTGEFDFAGALREKQEGKDVTN